MQIAPPRGSPLLAQSGRSRGPSPRQLLTQSGHCDRKPAAQGTAGSDAVVASRCGTSDGCKPSPHIRDDRDSGADAFGLMAIAYEEDRLI
jgi:hypothetical protein